jgi:hypothetical protein
MAGYIICFAWLYVAARWDDPGAIMMAIHPAGARRR